MMLIVRHFHQKTGHQGRGITMNAIRTTGYWIVNCSSFVASYVFKCVTCRKSRGVSSGQKMANSPTDRLEPSPPFTHVGTDCFGPFYVKDFRKTLKKYGAVFTCLTSRAVHIEMLNEMSADSFINGFRNVISIRWIIKLLRCDKGTNFVGAKNELKN